MLDQIEKYITVEKYLALEESNEFKSEFYQGELFPMAGTSVNHNIISGNLHTALNVKRNEHNCYVFISDIRLWIKHRELFTYPDLMIVRNKPEFYPGRSDTITNPLVIVEVLSESTENYDRGNKFLFYRSIPTFHEYILIDQANIHVEQFYIASHKGWFLTEFNHPDDILKFAKINFQISLADIYDLVEFPVK